MTEKNHHNFDIWDHQFQSHQEMWGMEPAISTLIVKDFFVEKGIKNVLIPGIGYGRNAQPFFEEGIKVTGIEISETAIALSKKHYGNSMLIYQGSVTDMPFDKNTYDGIYCYALIHLLNKGERKKLIDDCYQQLSKGGYMIFVMVSKEAPMYQQGKALEMDQYEVFGSIPMFFYDENSIHQEFKEYGLFEISRVNDVYPFYLIKCKK